MSLRMTSRFVAVRAFATKSKGRKPTLGARSKRARVSKPKEASLDSTWYTSKSNNASRAAMLDMGRYGLQRLDYSVVDPPFWPPPPHPPAKTFLEKYLYPATLLTIAGIAAWAYMNPEEEDMKEYWKRVESGQILEDDDDDYDEDWEDEDDE